VFAVEGDGRPIIADFWQLLMSLCARAACTSSARWPRRCRPCARTFRPYAPRMITITIPIQKIQGVVPAEELRPSKLAAFEADVRQGIRLGTVATEADMFGSLLRPRGSTPACRTRLEQLKDY
jgi:hypothetical protein